jgi:hypothetical protein
VGIEAEQGTADDMPGADEADEVLFGACVAALRASPGNCRACWELIDGEALMPVVDPGADPAVGATGRPVDELD